MLLHRIHTICMLNESFFSPSSCRFLLLHVQDLDFELEYGWNLDDLDVFCPNLEVLKLPADFQNREH